MSPARTSAIILLTSFVVYGLLVSTNEGEFWPFSIYPMFSQGGNDWSRALVREVEADHADWDTLAVRSLPGKPFPLLQHGIDPIDLANFVSKTRVWNDARVDGLRRMFGEDLDRPGGLLVLRVNGRMTTPDSIGVEAVPYALLTSSGAELNPVLSQRR